MKPSRNSLGWGGVWRWLAVTFIIGAIIFTVNIEIKSSATSFGKYNFMTKFSSMPWCIRKNIIMINPSVYISTVFFLKSIFKNCERHKDTNIEGSFSSYNPIFWRKCVRKFKIRWNITCKANIIKTTHHMFNRSLSSIFKYYTNISNIKSSIYLSIKSFNENISSLTMYHCVFSNFSTFYRGIGNSLGFSEGISQNKELKYRNSSQYSGEKNETERKPERRIIWWERILCSLSFLGACVYCARNSLNKYLEDDSILAWVYLIVGFLCGQFAVFTLRFGLLGVWF